MNDNIFVRFNQIHKKSLTKFIHLSRINSPYINKDYNKAFKANIGIFKIANYL